MATIDAMETDTRTSDAPTMVENRYANAPLKTTNKKEDDILFSPELLAMYYSRLFPFHLLHSWLSYDPLHQNLDFFSRREFSFTIMNDGEEIYLRYNSFSNQADLQSSILSKRPVKIDIGAIFDRAPKDKKAIADGTIQTCQRELVFDIDLTDYDEIRRCGCSGANICNKCWTMMTMAVKVMDQGLKEDFGFEHVAWFYSGRRGVHAWVCDETARTLSNEARSAVASYFEVNLGTDKNNKVFLPHPLHPMMARAFEILEPMFIKNILPESGHGLLANQDGWTTLFKTLPEAADAVKRNLEKKWSDPSCKKTPAEKWFQLKDHLQVFIKKTSGGGKDPKTMTSGDRIRIENWPTEVVFRYSYPRLDINVSKMQNHLLKSPFCVHPKTGRVCIPMQVETIESFDPFAVPTLPQLMRELDEYDASHKDSDEKKVLHDWQKTSLKQSFESFEKTFLGPMWKELRRDQRAAAEERAALTGDF